MELVYVPTYLAWNCMGKVAKIYQSSWIFMGYSDIVCWKVDFLLLGTWDANLKGLFARCLPWTGVGMWEVLSDCLQGFFGEWTFPNLPPYTAVTFPYPPGTKGGYKKTHARLYPLESIDPRDPGGSKGQAVVPVMDSGRVYSRSWEFKTWFLFGWQTCEWGSMSWIIKHLGMETPSLDANKLTPKQTVVGGSGHSPHHWLYFCWPKRVPVDDSHEIWKFHDFAASSRGKILHSCNLPRYAR